MENLPLLRPMLATSSKPYDSGEHLFEVKWDGYRCLSYLEGNTTVLYSRNGIDLSAKFPELVKLHGRVNSAPAILDGEIVVFKEGKPSFAALQSRGRMKNIKTIGRTSLERPAVFIVFDVLYSGGKSVMDLPLEKRKGLLEEMVDQGAEEISISILVAQERTGFIQRVCCSRTGRCMAKKLDSATCLAGVHHTGISSGIPGGGPGYLRISARIFRQGTWFSGAGRLPGRKSGFPGKGRDWF